MKRKFATNGSWAVQPRLAFSWSGLLLVLLWAYAPVSAADCCLQATPPIARYKVELDSYPQNFALQQAPDGKVYIGNHGGLGTFDGSRWSLSELPNYDVVRALAVAPNGRVYVGGQGLIGYFTPDSRGQLNYTDLTSRLSDQLPADELGSVRAVLLHEGRVYFRSRRHLVRFHEADARIRAWSTPTAFLSMGIWRGQLVAHERGRGLVMLGEEARPRLLPDSASLQASSSLIALDDQRLMIIGAQRWLVYDGVGLQSLAVPEDMPSAQQIRSAARLSESEVVLASSMGAIHIFEPDSGALRSIQLTPENLNSVARGRDGAILAASNDELFHLRWPSGIGSIGEDEGLRGSLWALQRWGDRWIGVTDAGFQELIREEVGVRVEPLNWTHEDAWAVLPWDEQRALLAAGGAIWWKDGQIMREVLPPEPKAKLLVRSPHDPNLVFVATFDGLHVLRFEQGQWRRLNTITGPNVGQIQAISREELWLGTVNDGIQRLRFSEDFQTLEAQQRFGADDGLKLDPTGGASIFADGAGGWVVSTEHAFYRVQDGAFEATDLDGLAQLRDAGEPVNLAVGPDGTRWAFSYKHIYRFDSEAQRWIRESTGQIRHGAIDHVAFEDDASALFSAGRKIIKVQATPPERVHPPTPIQLRSIQHISDSGHRVLLDHGSKLSFPHGGFSLSIRYSIPDIGDPGAVKYRAVMSGGEVWDQGWSTNGGLALFDLNAGTYVLQVQGRDSQGNISSLPPIPVEVRPPWYGTTWVRAGGLLIFLGLVIVCVWLFTNLRTRRINRLRQRLQRLVQKRTDELAQANAQLHALAHRDPLTNAANRRRLNEYLQDAWQHAQQTNSALSLLAIDVDNFKSYNDQHGHMAGDQMLISVVGAIEAAMQHKAGLLARFGGDEFIVVLPGTSLEEASDIADEACRQVEAGEYASTVTIGVACAWPDEDEYSSTDALTRAADVALYAAKRAGKNCVRRADQVEDADAVEFRRWA